MKNEMKGALAIIGTVFSPILAHAYQNSAGPIQPPSYNPGEMVREGQMPGVYEESASYVCDKSWDTFITGNYIYWTWSSSALQVGTIITEVTDTSVNTSTSDTAIFNTPGYTSGYQMGMGVKMKGMDNWSSYSKYTWYKSTNYQNFTGTTANPLVLASNSFRADEILSVDHLEGTITTKGQLGFQAADSVLQRPFTFGKKLIGNIYAGLRGMWISQNNAYSSSELIDNTTDQTMTDVLSKYDQTSWSLGPKLGFDSSWLLGYGIKVLGNIAQSALYTSFNTGGSFDYTRSNGTTSSLKTSGLHNYGIVTPVTESFLGLAWGTYMCSDNFHIDLSVGYDFNVYWNYNMVLSANSQTEGNLYIQGMNMQLRLDF
jgi:hypothetical protein